MTDSFRRTLEILADPGSTYARTFDASLMLDLSIGEARYPLPAAVRAEIGDATRLIERLWYSTPEGEPALRAAYLRKLVTEDGSRSAPGDTDVLVTAGGKEAAWLAIRYLLHRNRGGTVLAPRPGWEPYSLWLEAAGCTVVPYDPAAVAGDPTLLAALVSGAPSRPGLLILNYPNNPTGTSVDQAGMNQIMAAAAEHGLAVVSDEVYRAFAEDRASAAFAPAFDPARDAVVDSCSKWLGVAGLRVGFLLAGANTVREITAFRASYASLTSVLAQHVAASLLDSPAAADWLAATRADATANRQAVAARLEELGVPVVSQGCLYIWCRTPDPSKLSDPGVSDRVRLTPGDGLGSPNHFRLCTARDGIDPDQAAAAVIATLREC